MSSEHAIHASALSKSYRRRQHLVKHTTLAGELIHRVRSGGLGGRAEGFEALSDVNFTVEPGEVVGVIGRNGAGKSTLLKILARITRPTAGRVVIRGRVAALLEVGTGFHPELTGRENVYLNAAIQGMRRRDVEQAFGPIVEFAGVEDFLDTPVKHYSSGMQARLAFAVAAHLSADVLLIDEVLAVGDAEFQKRSLNRMRDIAGGGRTVIFVSHNLSAVSSLCTSGLYLSAGRVVTRGPIEDTIARYLSDLEDENYVEPAHRREGTGEVRIERVVCANPSPAADEPKVFRVDIGPGGPTATAYSVALHIHDDRGELVAHLDSRHVAEWFGPAVPRSIELKLRTPWLRPGSYSVDCFILGTFALLDGFRGAGRFTVPPSVPYPRGTTLPGGPVLADFSVEEHVASAIANS